MGKEVGNMSMFEPFSNKYNNLINPSSSSISEFKFDDRFKVTPYNINAFSNNFLDLTPGKFEIGTFKTSLSFPEYNPKTTTSSIFNTNLPSFPSPSISTDAFANLTFPNLKADVLGSPVTNETTPLNAFSLSSGNSTPFSSNESSLFQIGSKLNSNNISEWGSFSFAQNNQILPKFTVSDASLSNFDFSNASTFKQAENIKIDRTSSGSFSLPNNLAADGGLDERYPTQQAGRNFTTVVRLGANDFLPGGTIITTFRNTDNAVQNGESVGNAPRVDIRVVDKNGLSVAALQANRDNQLFLVSGTARDQKNEITGTVVVNPTNPSATQITLVGFAGNAGLRIQLNNPFGGETPLGRPGSEGLRVEGILRPDGVATITQTNANGTTRTSKQDRPIEVYGFYAQSEVPNTKIGSESYGIGVRGGNSVPVGEVPLTGFFSLELSQSNNTNARGIETQNPQIRGLVNLQIGKPTGIQGVIQGSGTVPLNDQPASGSIWGGIQAPLK